MQDYVKVREGLQRKYHAGICQKVLGRGGLRPHLAQDPAGLALWQSTNGIAAESLTTA